MTDIPDDVVERAFIAWGADTGGSITSAMRAALRVAVKWEREQCAKTVESVDPKWKKNSYVSRLKAAAAIRARY